MPPFTGALRESQAASNGMFEEGCTDTVSTMRKWTVAISAPTERADELEHTLSGGGGVLGAIAFDPNEHDPGRTVIELEVAGDSAEEARKLAVDRYASVGGVDGRVEAVRPVERGG